MSAIGVSSDTPPSSKVSIQPGWLPVVGVTSGNINGFSETAAAKAAMCARKFGRRELVVSGAGAGKAAGVVLPGRRHVMIHQGDRHRASFAERGAARFDKR